MAATLLPINANAQKNPDIESKINALMGKMSIHEKLGQTAEMAIDIIGNWQGDEFVVDQAKLQKVIGQYKVGSILNAPGKALTPQNWYKVISAIQELSMKTMGIPCVYGLDQNHGTTYTLGGTIFPQNINMAASFNRDLVHKAAEVTAYETRAANCPWTYSPTVDLSRDPRWPRMWENYGEDCFLSAEMCRAAVMGFQGSDKNNIGGRHVAVSLKHYLGYGSPRTGKDRTPAYIPEFEIREKHLAPFKAGVEAGALSVMVNSASVNGVPVHMSKHYLTDVLKKELGFDGVVVTDWADINNLYTREMVAKDKKDAIIKAINAGIDMTMEPYDLTYCTLLKEAVNEGKVPMTRLDDAVRRVLRMKFRLGLFDTPNTKMKDYPKFGAKEYAQLSEDAAVETQVLLKNEENILPLKQGLKILVTGPNANTMRPLDGGWTYTWQGDADNFAQSKNTIFEALQQRFGKNNVIYEPGVTYKMSGKYWEENTPEIEKAVQAAAQADIILACVGENSYCETPGNLNDLALSDNQRNLVRALAKTGKKIVLILNLGRPRIIADIEPLASAVVNTLIPGEHGADALARLLAGDDNFSARLPYTYPRYSAALTTYDYRVSEESGTMEGAYDYNALIDVQWPFGYGKSYTTFSYGDLKTDKTDFGLNDDITVSIDVTNTGKREGKVSVLLFSRDQHASLVPEVRRLRAFTKINLKPGETQTVSQTIKARDLAFVGTDDMWHLEEGKFMLQIEDKIAWINCTQDYTWK
ncbi:glycoside hydrolase family 3 N-terminal domain-containing protein [Hallella bergensis]|uniref:glycoside hydrolase family 3 N-terminal domain-containing protein n=1 Tax=Hallella bergensis TaxID=242750 RepID=UPI0023F45984|nr:glycoside hydrolase family 3 N-terminal domain-containing protein [Hallella bergensis]